MGTNFMSQLAVTQQKNANFIWLIADLLRGPYKPHSTARSSCYSHSGTASIGPMTLETILVLLGGGLISAGGGFVESMLAERRAGRRAERSALATKRIEQRDQLVVLVDAGRRWAVNLQTVMQAARANFWFTIQTEQYKAMGRFGDEGGF